MVKLLHTCTTLALHNTALWMRSFWMHTCVKLKAKGNSVYDRDEWSFRALTEKKRDLDKHQQEKGKHRRHSTCARANSSYAADRRGGGEPHLNEISTQHDQIDETSHLKKFSLFTRLTNTQSRHDSKQNEDSSDLLSLKHLERPPRKRRKLKKEKSLSLLKTATICRQLDSAMLASHRRLTPIGARVRENRERERAKKRDREKWMTSIFEE